jgi:hypothetical protein
MPDIQRAFRQQLAQSRIAVQIIRMRESWFLCGPATQPEVQAAAVAREAQTPFG